MVRLLLFISLLLWFPPKILQGIFLSLINFTRVVDELLISSFRMHSCCVYIIYTFGLVSFLNPVSMFCVSVVYSFYYSALFHCMNRSQFVYPFFCGMNCSSFWLLWIRLLWTFLHMLFSRNTMLSLNISYSGLFQSHKIVYWIYSLPCLLPRTHLFLDDNLLKFTSGRRLFF